MLLFASGVWSGISFRNVPFLDVLCDEMGGSNNGWLFLSALSWRCSNHMILLARAFHNDSSGLSKIETLWFDQPGRARKLLPLFHPNVTDRVVAWRRPNI